MTGNISFLHSRRWVGYFALATLFAMTCAALGIWQLSRRAEALTEIARIDNNYNAQAVPVEQILNQNDRFDEQYKWKIVTLLGHYLVDDEVLIRNRPFGGTVGFEVLTPFQLDSGKLFFVNRGWVPPKSDGSAPTVPPPSTEYLTVQVRLKVGEGRIAGRTASDNGKQLGTIDLPALAESLQKDSYTQAYGLLVYASVPALPPFPAAAPERDEGPHLSYSFQWFVFALLGFVGLFVAARNEHRLLTEELAENPNSTSEYRPKLSQTLNGTRKRDLDSEFEDKVADH